MEMFKALARRCGRPLFALADRQLQAELAQLQADLKTERTARRIVEAERDQLAGVVARDRARIKAETAAYAVKGAVQS